MVGKMAIGGQKEGRLKKFLHFFMFFHQLSNFSKLHQTDLLAKLPQIFQNKKIKVRIL